MSNRQTSLLAYVIDYLTAEHQHAIAGKVPEAVELVTADMVKEMVMDAIDAYEEGAQ